MMIEALLKNHSCYSFIIFLKFYFLDTPFFVINIFPVFFLTLSELNIFSSLFLEGFRKCSHLCLPFYS
jgi:hypothetical protein